MIRSKLWAADLTRTGPPPSASASDFVEIKAARLAEIAAAMGADGDRAAARFARGCRCFAVEQQGSIVAFGWLSTHREWIGELGLWITPAPGEGYVWNCYTLEPHRRRGNYRRLVQGFVELPDLRRLWIGSIDDPAEKADADAGFAPVLLFEVTRVAGLRLLRIRPAAGADPAIVGTARERLTPARALAVKRTRIH
ncbi:MAG TPA: GNAT family N-acetyltransferase [Candidatus Dormibacteraeota bacterium]|nr:GNAT family N-acetyltransferase [Candidatus Dormibacteraeota bacterium]